MFGLLHCHPTIPQSDHFPFLGINGTFSVSDMRCRTTFYTALGRLLMVDLGEDEDRFENFMVPITSAFAFVGAQLNSLSGWVSGAGN